MIRKLPKVSKSLKGYAVTFDGWYDAKNGGNPITVGSIAYYGQTLYAHWTQRAYQYKVHYVDLLKEKADDVQFHQNETNIVPAQNTDRHKPHWNLQVQMSYYLIDILYNICAFWYPFQVPLHLLFPDILSPF